MESESVQMDIESLERIYDRYSPFYDLIFGAFFSPGRKAAVNQLSLEEDDHVLEIGIGTGASIALYPKHTKITGVDLSVEMLRFSQKRADSAGREVALYLMNAEKLDFPDNSFTHVVAMYVVSVSPDPKTIIEEMERVCIPGGEVIILNHFSDEHSIIGKLEKRLAPYSSTLGFKPFFPMRKFMEHCTSFVFHKFLKTNLFGYWTILSGRKIRDLKNSTGRENI